MSAAFRLAFLPSVVAAPHLDLAFLDSVAPKESKDKARVDHKRMILKMGVAAADGALRTLESLRRQAGLPPAGSYDGPTWLERNAGSDDLGRAAGELHRGAAALLTSFLVEWNAGPYAKEALARIEKAVAAIATARPALADRFRERGKEAAAASSLKDATALRSAVGADLQRLENAAGEETPGASDEERFLYQQILANPEDDGPREKYAALAAQRGDPRADLIHEQLITASLRKGAAIAPQEIRRTKSAAALIAAHPEWADVVQGLGVRAVGFHRGFIDEVTITAASFVANAARLVKAVPVLHLRLRECGGKLAAVAACPELARIRSIEAEGEGVTDADVIALAGSSHGGKLRYLDLIRNKVTNAGVAALPNLKALIYCGLQMNPCDDPVDKRVFFDDTHYDWVPTEAGRRLEAKHGPLAWLHPRSEAWPPNFDQI